MTKVKMLVSIASPDWSYHPGQEIILEDELAKAWDKIGHCKIIAGDTSKPGVSEDGDKDANGTKNTSGKRATKS